MDDEEKEYYEVEKQNNFATFFSIQNETILVI
jgi:hypothetical protein